MSEQQKNQNIPTTPGELTPAQIWGALAAIGLVVLLGISSVARGIGESHARFEQSLGR